MNEQTTNQLKTFFIFAVLQTFLSQMGADFTSDLNILSMQNGEVSLCLGRQNVKLSLKVAGALEVRCKFGQDQSALPMGLVALLDPLDLGVPSVTAGRKTKLDGLCTLHKVPFNIQ